MAKSPLAVVKERFGSKEKLVGELVATLERLEGEDAAEFKARLGRASNKQLLRLHAVETRVREEFGTKEKLVDAVYALARKGKLDDSYKKRLEGLGKSQLLDVYLAKKRQAGATSGKTAAPRAKS